MTTIHTTPRKIPVRRCPTTSLEIFITACPFCADLGLDGAATSWAQIEEIRDEHGLPAHRLTCDDVETHRTLGKLIKTGHEYGLYLEFHYYEDKERGKS